MAFKMFNALRTIDRMKKYDYIKKSDFYKRARKLAREYNKANRQEKAIVRKLMEQHFNSNKAYSGVNKFNSFIDKERETLFERYASDDIKNAKGMSDKEKLNEFMSREQYVEYVDYIEKVKKAYEDYFYKADDAINAFRDVAVLGGKSIDEAFNQFRKQADGVPT